MATKGTPLKRPRNGQVVFGKNLQPVVDFCNAILNGEIVSGSSNEFIVGDRKVIWKIKSDGSQGDGSSNYRGEYEPTGATTFNPGPFVFGDIVRVSPTNPVATTSTPAGTVIPGVYICVLDAPSETDLPNHPLSHGGETLFWQWLATWPSATTGCDTDGNPVNKFTDEQNSNA